MRNSLLTFVVAGLQEPVTRTTEHPAMPMSDHQWSELCDEHSSKQAEYTRCLRVLFADGRIVSRYRLDESEKLRAAVREVRERMDTFLGGFRAHL
jgi:hypothetical protein